MNWIYGFFMAWGMFLAIPCPAKIWSENARRHMLVCLPLIGLIVGGIWALVAYLTSHIPVPLRAVLLAAVPWLCTGFMHLDGYMDVCDAVLSRRDLATRQRILKDSHCGAFAVICLCLLMLAQWSVFSCQAVGKPWALVTICVAVRACAGLAILLLRPMGTSQYAKMASKKAGFVAALIVLLVAAIGVGLVFGSFAAPATAAAYWFCTWRGFRQLDGMNGDISGFSLTVAELVGAAVWVLVG